jgi:hypothetical protein
MILCCCVWCGPVGPMPTAVAAGAAVADVVVPRAAFSWSGCSCLPYNTCATKIDNGIYFLVFITGKMTVTARLKLLIPSEACVRQSVRCSFYYYFRGLRNYSPLPALKPPYNCLAPSYCSLVVLFPTSVSPNLSAGWSFLEDGSNVLLRNFGTPYTTTHKTAIWVAWLPLMRILSDTTYCNALHSELMIRDAKIYNSGITGLQSAIHIAFVVLLLPYSRVCIYTIYSTITSSCTYTVTATKLCINSYSTVQGPAHNASS